MTPRNITIPFPSPTRTLAPRNPRASYGSAQKDDDSDARQTRTAPASVLASVRIGRETREEDRRPTPKTLMTLAPKTARASSPKARRNAPSLPPQVQAPPASVITSVIKRAERFGDDPRPAGKLHPLERLNSEGILRDDLAFALTVPGKVAAARRRDACLLCRRPRVNEAGLCDVCTSGLEGREATLVNRWMTGQGPEGREG